MKSRLELRQNQNNIVSKKNAIILKNKQWLRTPINEGKLPRGVAYDVGDGLVSTDLLEKMKPEASTLQTPMLATDGKIYGATFLAYHARPVSEIYNLPWQVNVCFLTPQKSTAPLLSIP